MATASTTTAVVQDVTEPKAHGSESVKPETLTLMLVPKRKKKAVKWAEEVVDNEFAGKKSSKKCCIFHKKRAFGDWSDEDSDCEC